MGVYIGDVPTFKHVANEKEQAVKVLEEAGEVVDAFKAYREAALTDWTEPDNANEYRMACDHLIDECADVLQATCNLLSALNVVDMTKWIERCKAKNERRGREYERDLELSVQVTEVGKTSASSRQSDVMDSREKLEADAMPFVMANAERCGGVAFAMIEFCNLLDRQAAITRDELVDCANCPITERNAEVIAELREQLDEMKHAIAKAGGTWTEREDRTIAVVFAPDVDKLRADRDKLQAKMDSLTAERNCWRDKCGKMLDIAHEIARLGDVE